MRKNYIGLLRRKETTDNPKKNGWLMGAFAAAALLLGGNSFAQTNIANYTFAKSTGATYTPITGGTKVFPSGTNTTYDNDVSAAITLPSTFNYGGTAITNIYISANGYITFGAAPSGSTYTPMSTADTGVTGVIAAFAQDGGFSSSDTTQPVGNHEVRYQDLGAEFVVQWQDHANYSNRATERLNFQIRLNYATGAVNIIYGNCTDPGTVSTSNTTPQVGLRGNSTTYATNVNSLLIGNIPAGTVCDWSKAVTGFANSSTMLFSGTNNVNVKIPTGLQYTWTPGTQLPVRTFGATTAITTSGATLSWTAPTGATTYNVQYRLPGACDWTNWSGNPVSATTAVLTGLDQGTNYQARVQALNGSAQSIYSHIPNTAGTGDGYSLTGTFATLSSSTCTSTVTGLTSSAITPNNATISWTASASAPANGYEYYYSTSSAIPAYTVTPSGSTAAGVVTANITGLIPSTVYYYFVRTNCDGTNKGAWSSSANFTTLGLCPTVTAPTAGATGVSTTPTITWTAISGVTGYKVNVGTTSGGNNVVANADVPTGTSYVFTTPLNNGTTYYYSVTAYTATSSAPATPCAIRSFTTVLLCPSTVTGLTSSAITPNTATISWTASTTPPANGYEYYYSTSSTTPTATTTPSGVTAAGIVTASLSGLAPSTQYYYWVRTNCNGTDKGAWSSSANFTTLGLCPTVTAPTAGATGVGTTPTITWTAISGVTGYKVNVGTTSGGNNVVANADVPTGTSYVFTTPLSSATTYYYSVTAYTATSAAPATPCTVRSFTTACPGLTTLPWTENFDSMSTTGAGVVPTCWGQSGGYSGYPFTSAGTSGNTYNNPKTNPNYMTIYWPYNSAAYLWTPLFTLQAGNTYEFSFNWVGDGATGWDGTVLRNTSQSSTGATTVNTFATTAVATTGGSESVAYQLVTITFTPTTTGDYTFGIRTFTSSFSPNWLGFDDFKLINTASLGTSDTAATSKNDIKVYPNPFADVLNISDVKNVKSVSVIDIAGRLVKTIEKPSSALQLGELKSGMYVVVLNMNDGSKQTIKAIKK